jgi:hypothetical protein
VSLVQLGECNKCHPSKSINFDAIKEAVRVYDARSIANLIFKWQNTCRFLCYACATEKQDFCEVQFVSWEIFKHELEGFHFPFTPSIHFAEFKSIQIQFWWEDCKKEVEVSP